MLTPEEEAELAQLEAQYGADSPTKGLSKKARAFLGSGESSTGKEFLGGLKHSLDRAAYGVKSLLPESVQKFGDDLDRQLGLEGLNKEKYEQGKAFVSESSGAADAGSIVGDIAMGLAPGGAALRGGNILKQALARKGLFNFGTAVGTEMAGNAAWNAAVSPENRDTAALLGGAGSAAGSVANRFLSGPLAHNVTPEARRMMDRGVGLTAGQMISGSRAPGSARTFRGLEDSATSTAILGDVIKHRSIGAVKDWNNFEINKILEPVGIKVKTAGNAGIEDASIALRKAYDEIIDKVSVKPAEATEFLNDMAEGLKYHPLLNDNQRKYIEKWVNLHLGRHVTQDVPIDGHTARVIDRGFDEEVAKWHAKGGAWDQSIADSFEELHKGWRSLLVSAEEDPQAAEKLAGLIRAQDELKLVQLAASKSNEGMFSPMQLQRVYERQNRPLSRSLKDAKATLPNTVPDTGTAGRTILYHMLAPAGVSGAATSAGFLTGFGPLVTTAAALGGAYTKPGTMYLGSGVKPILNKLGLKNLSRDEMEYAIKLLGQQSGRAGLNEYNAQE